MVQLNDKTQRIVADILTRFMFTRTMDDVWKVWNDIFNEFHLSYDPFVHTPCSHKQYLDNSLEFQRQIMIERYGHCDGLD